MKNKILTIMITLLIAISLISVPVYTEAKKINCKSRSVYVKNSINLKIKGKASSYKWSSNNKKIATVSKSGKVKSHKVGNVTITARKGKNLYVYKVKVKKHTAISLKKKINKYFKNSEDFKYCYVAEDFDVEKEGNKYTYIIRSTGGREANVLVGNLTVNAKNGEAVFFITATEGVRFNVLE